MKNALRRVGHLFGQYKAHQASIRPLPLWISVVGSIAYPLLYALQLTAPHSDPDSEATLQLYPPAFALCLALVLHRHWSRRMAPSRTVFSWVAVTYCLSYLLAYTLLRQGGGVLAVWNSMMGAALIVLLAGWRNAVAIQALGWTGALIMYALPQAHPSLPADALLAAVGSLSITGIVALLHRSPTPAHRQRGWRHLSRCTHATARVFAQLTSTVSRQRQAAWLSAKTGIDIFDSTCSLEHLHPSAKRPPDVHSAVQCARRALANHAYESPRARECMRLEVEGDFFFQGSLTSFELTIFSLMKNALHYLPMHPDLQVRVVVRAAPEPCIIVRDNGPGIPPDFMPHLFKEFQTHGKAEAAGLGLAFCRRFMQGLGGGIQCRSSWGRYSEFTLSFPPLPAAAGPTAEPPPGLFKGRTAMVVDNQLLNRTITRELFDQLGLSVREAGSGEEALARLKAGQLPDLVVMSLSLPELDGMATTRRVRALPGAAGGVPVLALTAHDSAAVRALALEAGMQGVLGKPIDLHALQRALVAVFKGSKTLPPSKPMPCRFELLNMARVENFRRLNLTEELVPRALLDMRRHLQRLEHAAATEKRQSVIDTLHALVGLSGEVGAQVLHVRAREHHAAWLAGRGVAAADWILDLRAVLEGTEKALWRHCRVRPADPTSPMPLL